MCALHDMVSLRRPRQYASFSLSVQNLSRQRFFFSPSAFPSLTSVLPFSYPKISVFFFVFFAVEEIRIVLFHSLRVLSKAVYLLCEEILAVSGCFQHKGHSLLKVIMSPVTRQSVLCL